MSGTEQEEPIVSATSNSMEVILTRMEGKMDRIGDRMSRYEQDVTGVRSRIHDLANEVSPLVMLDLPGRIRVTDQWKADHDARIKALEHIEQQRKGAAALAKILWAILGATVVGAIAALVRFLAMGTT